LFQECSQGCSLKVSLLLNIGYPIFSTLKICKILLSQNNTFNRLVCISLEFTSNLEHLFFFSFHFWSSGTRKNVVFRWRYIRYSSSGTPLFNVHGESLVNSLLAGEIGEKNVCNLKHKRKPGKKVYKICIGNKN